MQTYIVRQTSCFLSVIPEETSCFLSVIPELYFIIYLNLIYMQRNNIKGEREEEELEEEEKEKEEHTAYSILSLDLDK